MMSIMGNTLLGFIIAMLINFVWTWIWSRLNKPEKEELLENVHKQFFFSEPQELYNEFRRKPSEYDKFKRRW